MPPHHVSFALNTSFIWTPLGDESVLNVGKENQSGRYAG